MQKFGTAYNNLKRPAREGRLVTVGRVEDVPAGCGATVELEGGKELALFRLAGGDFHAVENFCPHRGAPLADGDLRGPLVECGWHGWRFDVRTGACLGRISQDIETYRVVIEDGLIKVEV